MHEDRLEPGDPHWSLAGRTPTTAEDRTGWMVFHASGPLQLQRLSAEQVHIGDIVQGLGANIRFNGQTRTAIPVLWHSLMVAELCRAESRELQLEALFHDASEAYVGDWIRPIKPLVGDGLHSLQARIQATVFAAVGIPGAPVHLARRVKRADDLMVRYELASDWGYGRTVTWHDPPTAAESDEVGETLETVGAPPEDSAGTDRNRAEFIERARRLLAPGAPVWHSMPGGCQGPGRR